MIEVSSELTKIQDLKCGEIFCTTATTYRVACCLCGSKVLFEQFLQHFQAQHLQDFNNEPQFPIKDEDTEEVGQQKVSEVEQASDESEIEDEKPIDLVELNVSEHIMIANLADRADEGSTSNNDENDGDGDVDDLVSNKETLPFPCTKCDRGYYLKSSLRGHMHAKHHPSGVRKRTKTMPKLFKCEHCDVAFQKEQHLISHKLKHTGIVCDICGLKFTLVGNLVRHKLRHTGIRPHKCDQCDMSFFTNVEKRAHMLSHTKQKPHVCELCGKAVRVLSDHIRRRHTGERPAKCDVCGKTFVNGRDLNLHAASHTTERPFRCDICDATFQLKKTLWGHKKVHHKVHEHVSKLCGKNFLESGGLQTHLCTHDDAKKVFSKKLSANSSIGEDQKISE